MGASTHEHHQDSSKPQRASLQDVTSNPIDEEEAKYQQRLKRGKRIDERANKLIKMYDIRIALAKAKQDYAPWEEQKALEKQLEEIYSDLSSDDNNGEEKKDIVDILSNLQNIAKKSASKKWDS